MSKLRVLDLFSGIGGFSLGLERTGGFETVAFCEIEPFPRKVLAKHWPKVPQYHDVRTLTKDILDRDGIAVDVICGGFPCQDISVAGKGTGIGGDRSGLWSEFARLIGELRPALVLVENVSALLGRGLAIVLGEMATLGYDAEWHCIPASALGAPHRRDRLWIIAYPNQDGLQEREHVLWAGGKAPGGKLEGRPPQRVPSSQVPAHAHEGEQPLGGSAGRIRRIIQSLPGNRDWPVTAEPVLARGADGIPDRLDRCGALGNAVVPQIPELIGNAILQSMATP